MAHGHVREHVRVAADQLGHDPVRDVVDGVAGAVGALGRDPGVEGDLEQDIAEFLAERVGVAALQGVHRLVALLQQVRGQRGVRLLRVPGALGAQPVHDGHQLKQPRAGQARARLAGLAVACLRHPGP